MIGEDVLCDLVLPDIGDEDIEPVGSMAVPGAVQLANAKKAKATPNTVAELFPIALERMRARGRGEERMVPVPWEAVARQYRGEHRAGLEVLRPGVHYIVGGTGSGKTQLALSIALEAARAGAPVTYICLELDKEDIIARLMSIEAAREQPLADAHKRWPERWSHLSWPEGKVSRDALERVAALFEKLLSGPIGRIRIEAKAAGAYHAEDFAADVEEAKAKATEGRPALVVLDFLQQLGPNPDARYHGDKDKMGRIARAAYAASEVTRDGKAVVLALSSTARSGYKLLDGLKLNELTNLQELIGLGKESGDIEYSATSVVTIGRLAPLQAVTAWPELKELKGWSGGLRLLAFPKGRATGDAGWVALGWDGGAFYDIDKEGKRLAESIAGAKKTAAAARRRKKGGDAKKEPATPDWTAAADVEDDD